MKGLFKSVFVAIAIDAVDLIIINESAREKHIHIQIKDDTWVDDQESATPTTSRRSSTSVSEFHCHKNHHSQSVNQSPLRKRLNFNDNGTYGLRYAASERRMHTGCLMWRSCSFIRKGRFRGYTFAR